MQGDVVVVVGAGSAIGAASVQAFAVAGAHVVAVDPHLEPGKPPATGEGNTGTIEVLPCALDSSDGAAQVAARCREAWGHVDALFTCQGRLDRPHPADGAASLEHWHEVLQANLLGPIAYTEALWPLLCTSGHGSVVYLSSIDGLLGNPRFPAYSVSKGGLIPLTHVMANDGAAHGVRVNAIAMAAMTPTGPGDPVPVAIPEPARAAVAHATPLPRSATPDDVAGVAVFLCSRQAAYVTGTVLPVDGGRTAVTPGTGARAADPYTVPA